MSEGESVHGNPGEDPGEFLGYVGGWRWLPFIAAFVAIFFSAIYMFISRLQSRIQNAQIENDLLRPGTKNSDSSDAKEKSFIKKKFKDLRKGVNEKVEKVGLKLSEYRVPKYSRSGRKLRQRERAMILASKFAIFKNKKEAVPLQLKEMPEKLLNPDMREIEDRLPQEINMMYKTVRVFGHFDKPVFLSLCKHMVIDTVSRGDYLFRRGEPDEWIYVVQDGAIDLLVLQDGQESPISEVRTGESIASLLSVLDVLTGNVAPYKTVSARAAENSIVIKLPASAISQEFENFPASLVRIVQMIMLRLQRVTFLALHDYLGLSEELVNPAAGSSLVRVDSFHRTHRTSVSSDDSTGMSKRNSLPVHLEDDEGSVKSFGSDRSSPAPFKRSVSMTGRKARFHTLEAVIDDDDKHYRHTSTNNNADFAKAVERAFSRDEPEESSPEKVDLDGCDKFYDEDLFRESLAGLCVILGLEDESLLADIVTMIRIKANTIISDEGDQDPSLYYVVSGRLVAEQQMEERVACLYEATPGSISGQLSVLTGEPTFFKTKARETSVVLTMSKVDFYGLMADHPKVVLNLAHTVVSRLSSFVRQIDFALDWVLVEAGQALYSEGEKADCLYIVLNGRLRSVKNAADGSQRKEMVCEFGRSECVGLVDCYGSKVRTTSIHAVRDTEVARIPAALMHHIKRLYPTTVQNIISLMTDQVMRLKFKGDTQNQNIFTQRPENSHEESIVNYGGISNHLANISTVAILTSDEEVTLDLFSMELANVLKQHGSVQRLNSDTVRKRLGERAMEQNNEYRLTTWLGQQEDVHRMTLYQCDATLSNWTKRCLRQADCILIVAMGDSKPKIGELEMELDNYAVRALKILVLLHKEEVESPHRTAEWLNLRGWLTNHFHIKIPTLMTKKQAQRLKKDVIKLIREKNENPFSDFSRLARFLTGRSIGVVFGGGGARGITQISMLDVLHEKGVPVDMVGGTSIGSLVGGLYAISRDSDTMKKSMGYFCTNMSKLWRKVIDLTYPQTAMFSGAGFNHEIYSTIGDRQIEDLWIPYFAITTDLSSSRMRVHGFGSLWRYIRASMTLTGYLPPLCDPTDGHYLVDGGYINNLPADVAKARGASIVIAIDVGARDTLNLTNYGDAVSGWWLLFKKWWPWTQAVNIPDLNGIQSRLAYIACNHLLEEVKNSDYCFYLRCEEIMRYKTLDFDKFEEILEYGAEQGRLKITDEWASALLERLEAINDQQKPLAKRKRARGQKSGSSFVDLANFMVSKVSRKSPSRGENALRPFFSECSDEEHFEASSLNYVSDSNIAEKVSDFMK